MVVEELKRPMEMEALSRSTLMDIMHKELEWQRELAGWAKIKLGGNGGI